MPAALLTYTLTQMAQEIAASAVETIDRAQMQPQDVTRLILVGGSSLMAVVEGALRKTFPQAEVHQGSALTAIVDGLALASENAFAQSKSARP